MALGANLGDVVGTLTSAVRRVAGLPGVRSRDVSPLVETDPVGGPDQPVYLNAVLLAQTRLAPWTLLRPLHDDRGGARPGPRDPVGRADPRPRPRPVRRARHRRASVASDDPELVLPHPRAADRAFVLEPWRMVDPEAVLRVGGDVVAVADRLEQLDRDGRAARTRTGDRRGERRTRRVLRLVLVVALLTTAVAWIGLQPVVRRRPRPARRVVGWGRC